MPFLIRIGANNYNQSRVTRRGYHISRHDKNVIVEYGPIDLIAAKYYWVGAHLPRIIVHRFRTKEKASEFARNQVLNQLADNNSGHYIKLPPNIRIRAYRFNPRRFY